MTTTYDADVVIAGGGLAGLATAFELLEQGRRVLVLDRDTEDRLGGLAKRSFGGVMFVDTPHQRKLGTVVGRTKGMCPADLVSP